MPFSGGALAASVVICTSLMSRTLVLMTYSYHILLNRYHMHTCVVVCLLRMENRQHITPWTTSYVVLNNNNSLLHTHLSYWSLACITACITHAVRTAGHSCLIWGLGVITYNRGLWFYNISPTSCLNDSCWYFVCCVPAI